MIIDLRSDTVTKPSKAMLEAMMHAEVGDDVFEEDPTVMQLEAMAAGIFGKEAGLFCPSGTMTNQVAVKVHTRPGDEVICDKTAHMYLYEGGGIAFNSGASVRLINGNRGRFTAEEVLGNINADNVHFPVTRLVVVENTVNRGGGAIWKFADIKDIASVCRNNKLKLHLDGARIFNALAETGEKPIEYGALFDSVSVCLSKGLGAPIGSVLLGDKEFIKQARRVRKVLGGGMRQVGILAAAGIFALQNNIERLKDDHRRAKALEKILQKVPFVQEVLPVETNIVIAEFEKNIKAADFIGECSNVILKRLLLPRTEYAWSPILILLMRCWKGLKRN